MTDKSFFDNEISEKEEIPFKMLRYQNTEHGVFDLTRNLYMDSRECATQLQKYLEENHELASENEELNQKNELLTLQLDCHKHPLLKENRELVSDLNHELEVSNSLRDVVKSLETENTQLRKDLIDYSALVQMLESCTGLSIEDILYNKTGAESQEEFDKIHKTYHDKAKQWWGKKE